MSVARKVIYQFVGYLERQETELVWKSRCKTTIERERELSITPRLKRAPYKSQRDDWGDGYGYICAEGYCPCGALQHDHKDGRCPGPTLGPADTDRTLLSCLLGERQPST